MGHLRASSVREFFRLKKKEKTESPRNRSRSTAPNSSPFDKRGIFVKGVDVTWDRISADRNRPHYPPSEPDHTSTRQTNRRSNDHQNNSTNHIHYNHGSGPSITNDCQRSSYAVKPSQESINHSSAPHSPKSISLQKQSSLKERQGSGGESTRRKFSAREINSQNRQSNQHRSASPIPSQLRLNHNNQRAPLKVSPFLFSPPAEPSKAVRASNLPGSSSGELYVVHLPPAARPSTGGSEANTQYIGGQHHILEDQRLPKNRPVLQANHPKVKQSPLADSLLNHFHPPSRRIAVFDINQPIHNNNANEISVVNHVAAPSRPAIQQPPQKLVHRFHVSPSSNVNGQVSDNRRASAPLQQPARLVDEVVKFKRASHGVVLVSNQPSDKLIRLPPTDHVGARCQMDTKHQIGQKDNNGGHIQQQLVIKRPSDPNPQRVFFRPSQPPQQLGPSLVKHLNPIGGSQQISPVPPQLQQQHLIHIGHPQQQRRTSISVRPQTAVSTLPLELQANPSEITFNRKLGTGASADVWRGTWRGADVAIKVLHSAPPTTSNIGRQGGPNPPAPFGVDAVSFHHELKIAATLRHPNLVLLMGASVFHSPVCLISECCEGGNLYDLLHRPSKSKFDNGNHSGSSSNKHLESASSASTQTSKPSSSPAFKLSLAQRLKVAIDVAKGCLYLHTAKPQIIHRDLKSLNILLASRVTSQSDPILAKIADFGLSKTTAPGGHQFQSEGWAGTVCWMAPELFLKRPFTEKIDVYAFGVLLFEIFTGLIPYGDKQTDSDIMKGVIAGSRPHVTPQMILSEVRWSTGNGHQEQLQTSTVSSENEWAYDIHRLMTVCWSDSAERRPSFASIVEDLKAAERKSLS